MRGRRVFAHLVRVRMVLVKIALAGAQNLGDFRHRLNFVDEEVTGPALPTNTTTAPTQKEIVLTKEKKCLREHKF